MKNLLIASAIVLASASATLANTTTNRITTGSEHGHRQVDVKNIRTETGSYNNSATSLKMDSVADSGFAGVNTSFDGSKFTGTARATQNNGGVDPFTNQTYVTSTETGTFTDLTKTNVVESTDFNSTYIEYSLQGNW